MEQAIERKITVIPVNPKFDYKAAVQAEKKDAGAYCRVSTDSEDQMSSYKAQVAYYTKFIKSNPDLNFVDIYADEGLSGTSVKKRKDFQRMMSDARAGKLKIIYVKSISRFARNTLDCVTYIRELRELGVNVHFESLNIDTMDSKGELLVNILASIAEDESRNISQNIRWAVEKKFMKGEVIISTLYGYKRKKIDKKSVLQIVPEEAAVVRRINHEFLSGYSLAQIAARLQADGVKTYKDSGKKKWYPASIHMMLTNEKYKGDALLQKTYQANFLSKKRVKNEGQAKQYLVENSHPPIIDRETYDKVQAELKRRDDLAAEGDKAAGKFSSRHVFSTMVRCACGDTFRRYMYYYKTKKTPMWICRTHELKKKECAAKAIKETQIEGAFLRAINAVVCDRDAIIKEIVEAAGKIITDADQAAHDAKKAELDILREEMLELTKTYQSEGRASEEQRARVLKVMAEIEQLMAETKFITDLINSKKLAKHRLADIKAALESGKLLNEFDGAVFKQMIKEIVVDNGELEFVFNCGIKRRERV